MLPWAEVVPVEVTSLNRTWPPGVMLLPLSLSQGSARLRPQTR